MEWDGSETFGEGVRVQVAARDFGKSLGCLVRALEFMLGDIYGSATSLSGTIGKYHKPVRLRCSLCLTYPCLFIYIVLCQLPR